MAQMVELEVGLWLDGLPDGEAHEIQSLCHVISHALMDTVLSLALFEQASVARQPHDREAWDRDRDAERRREEELAAEDPRDFSAPDYMEWRMRLGEQARSDLVRRKWAAGELPNDYAHRLPFLHARAFLTSLAQVNRAIRTLEKLMTEPAKEEIAAARQDFELAVPTLKGVRDSIEHAEDRMRGRGKNGNKLVLAPVTNGFVHAPAGGVLIGDSLNGRHFGCTIEDGQYAEVEISDETVEHARRTVQRIFDALPWKPGHTRRIPHS